MFQCRKYNQFSGYDTKTGICVELNIYVERGTHMMSKRDNHVIVFDIAYSTPLHMKKCSFSMDKS